MAETDPDLLFVYGTLRRGADAPMARWLGARALYHGAGMARGMLYRVADYPGFVPGDKGAVAGDLFILGDDRAAMLAALDEYEQCSAHFAAPHEYRREVMTIASDDGPVEAWVWCYAWPVAGLEQIAGGDFLAG